MYSVDLKNLCLSITLILLPSLLHAAELSGSRPNVIVVLCDDLGYGDLECYGHPVIKTPNLNKLAGQGIRFTSCYASAPVCSSSRAGMMTGRTPSRVGVYDWIPDEHTVHLPKSETTVATLLKQAGYDTAHVGKWHLNGKFNQAAQPQPGDHGFDHWFSTQNNAIPSHENPKNYVRNGKAVGPLEGYSCQLVADEAIDWLQQQQSADKSNPFFMFVCFHEPHEPVASPKELVKAYLPQAKNEAEAQYFANVGNIDLAVGRLMKTLDDLKLNEDTLLFFTSDNGPETLNRYRTAKRSYGRPGPLRGMKLWMYEGGIRVAGILRWTGTVKAGQELDVPVCGLDVLPTLCELANVKPPQDRTLDGASFVSVLAGQPVQRPRPLYWHYYRAIGEPKAALRSGDWMVLGERINNQNKPLGRNVSPEAMEVIKSTRLGNFELYNLKMDLKQQHDMASEKPELLKQLSQQLIQRHSEVQSEGPDWYAAKN